MSLRVIDVWRENLTLNRIPIPTHLTLNRIPIPTMPSALPMITGPGVVPAQIAPGVVPAQIAVRTQSADQITLWIQGSAHHPGNLVRGVLL